MVVQVNGKIIREIEDKKIVKVVVVPGKLVNLVAVKDDKEEDYGRHVLHETVPTRAEE